MLKQTASGHSSSHFTICVSFLCVQTIQKNVMTNGLEPVSVLPFGLANVAIPSIQLDGDVEVPRAADFDNVDVAGQRRRERTVALFLFVLFLRDRR
jgi:hypothetical protein